MKPVDGTDIHGIHVLVRQDRVDIRRSCKSGTAFFARTQHVQDLTVWLRTNGIGDPLPSNITCANQPPTDRIIYWIISDNCSPSP